MNEQFTTINVELLQFTANSTTGDLHLLEAAKLQANTAFRQNAALDPKSKETEDAIVHANDVAKILRQNIVQGRAIGDDKYSRPPLSCAISCKAKYSREDISTRAH